MIGSLERLLLCVDGSVDVKSKIGYGAYLAIFESDIALDELEDRINVKRFEKTSSTKLELQTLLWALGDINISDRKLIVYTDSQNIVGLRRRRHRFEKNDFSSANNKKLHNAGLYQEFFRITDALDCEIVQVHGHLKVDQRGEIDQLFSLVDRASRKALRGELYKST